MAYYEKIKAQLSRKKLLIIQFKCHNIYHHKIIIFFSFSILILAISFSLKSKIHLKKPDCAQPIYIINALGDKFLDLSQMDVTKCGFNYRNSANVIMSRSFASWCLLYFFFFLHIMELIMAKLTHVMLVFMETQWIYGDVSASYGELELDEMVF